MKRTRNQSADLADIKRPRRLVLADAENLTGGPRYFCDAAIVQARRDLYAVLDDGGQMLTIVSCSHYWAKKVLFAWPEGCHRWKSFKNGADEALVHAAHCTPIEGRIDEVVIGSGDGFFAQLAADLATRGVRTIAVCRPGSLARRLELAVHEVRFLPALGTGDEATGAHDAA